MISTFAQILKIGLISVPILVATELQAAKTTPVPSPEIKPLLGFVELNKTTLGEFVEKLEAQGCTITFHKGVALVVEGCMQLPGNPKIRAITSVKEVGERSPWESLDSVKKLPTEWANLTIESLDLVTRYYPAWKEYLSSLSNTWGKPSSLEGYDGASGSVAVWKKNHLDVELRRLSGYTWITYVSKDRKKKIEEILLAQKKNTQRNLELL
ncbi:MAG: hypothetical protein LUC43_10085 [Burkholderiales bacterium]|nr:hypothetical protein [Burkholderiales bacterium]